MERFLSKYTCCYLIIIIIRDDVGINRKISLERSQTGGKPGKVCDWIKVIQVWLIARLSFILCYDSRPKNRTKAKNHLLMVLLNKCQNRFYLSVVVCIDWSLFCTVVPYIELRLRWNRCKSRKYKPTVNTNWFRLNSVGSENGSKHEWDENNTWMLVCI